MAEKKQFFIPKNYDKKFEWIPGISGWLHLVFVPVIVADYFILQHAPFDFSNKVVIIVISLAFPWFLIGTHPVRENVSLYKHLYWKLKFLSRQRTYHYKKEGYQYAIQEEIRAEHERKTRESQDSEATKTITENSSRPDSGKEHRARVTYNAKSEIDSMPKSISR